MVKDRRSGFTLIELIVVIFIIILFSGMSIAYFGTFGEEKKLVDEVKRIEATLYLARSKANSADAADPSTCTDFRGYRVSFVDPSTFDLEKNCGGTYTLIQEHVISQGITISSSTPLRVLFRPLNVGTDLTAPTTITLRNAKTSSCIDISLTPLGVINEGTKTSC